MNTRPRSSLSRRVFLRATAGLATATMCTRRTAADESSTSPGPRATSGDLIEPRWKKRLTITVGPKDADLIGTTNAATGRLYFSTPTRLGAGQIGANGISSPARARWE